MNSIRQFLSKKREALTTVSGSLLSIVFGFIFGGLLLLVLAITLDNVTMGSFFDGFRIVLAGIFNLGRDSGELAFGLNPRLLGDMLFRATPLIMTGLAVAVAFKTGLFNIGVAGQYLMGTMACIVVALSLDTKVFPAWLVWLLAFLAAGVAGALWGCIPGLFKALLNINEVITSIMTNWIAANLVTMVFVGSKFINTIDYGKVGYTYKLETNGISTAGLDGILPGNGGKAGILIVILIAIICYIIINKTTFGFELQACGSNKNAARFAGMKDKRNIVLAMAISGALAGLGAALYYLNGDIEFYWKTSMSLPMTGFNGIPVALLANCNPIGAIFSGMFMSYLSVAGSQLSIYTPFNEFIANIIIATIVYLSAFTAYFASVLNRKKKDKKKASTGQTTEHMFDHKTDHETVNETENDTEPKKEELT